MSEKSKPISLEDILITEVLSCRSPKAPALETENQALHTLVRQLAQSPQTMLKTLVAVAKDLTQAGTAGVSLLEVTPSGKKIFRWVALAGKLERYEQNTTPGDFSPCGVCLERRAPQLYSHPEQYFTYLQQVKTAIVEGLVIPLASDEQSLGTIWIVSHDEQRHFDAEDVRVMTSLADFTVAALVSSYARQAAEESQGILHQLLEHIPEAITIMGGPPEFQIVATSKLTQVLLGRSGESLIGISCDHYVKSSDWLKADGTRYTPEQFPLYRAIRHGEIVQEEECVIERSDGTRISAIANALPMQNAQGEIIGAIDCQYDISERKRMEEALHESQTRIHSLMANMPGMAYRYVPSANSSARFTFVNFGCLDLFEVEPELAMEDAGSILRLIHPDDFPSFQASVAASVKDFLPWQWQGRIITASGKLKWIQGRSCAARTTDGDAWDGVLIDITDLKQAEAQLRHDALHDALTGLANRSLLMDRLEQALKHYQRHNERSFALLYLDIDRFKGINDSLGHLAGDRLLLNFTCRLQGCLRNTDTIARLGGDEFVVLLEYLSHPDEALQIAERIHEFLVSPFTIEEREIFVSTSIGIAFSSSHYSQPAQLLRDADTALYQAKARGKGCHVVFAPSMHLQAVRQFSLESDLRWAIERQEFVVHYQPIISLSTLKLQGVEALVRWQHPKQGMISPSEFILIAEETGVIVDLDQWVLRSACQQLRAWQKQFPTLDPFTVSVNLSGKQFAQPNLVEYIDTLLTETGLEGSCLKLEITESILIDNPDSAAEMIAQLQKRNIQISLDDFGTGYSSLSYLHRFPLNALKIDRSFVSNLEASRSNLTIVRTIITMAFELGIGIIAEGIETQTQAEFLQSLGCHYGQGYYFFPPLNAEALTSLLDRIN